MLITERDLRRLINRELIKEISDEKFKELENYVKKQEAEYLRRGLRTGAIQKYVQSPESQKKFDMSFHNIDKPLEDYQEKTSYYQSSSLSDDVWDVSKMNARYHKKWWWDQHDKSLFNNPADLASRQEKIIAIHDLSAYAPQDSTSLDEFCQLYNGIYNTIRTNKQKNELSAFGYINLDGYDAYEICKNLIGKTISTGQLNHFFYLNPRTITYAAKVDVCTEKFSDYRQNYFNQTKNSGTRKYPMHFKSSIENNLKNKNVMDHFSVLDEGDFPTNNRKILHEMTVGNWQPDSFWINIDFNDFYNGLDTERQQNKDITVKEYVEKNNFRNYRLLYFFALKGIKCFDCNGQKLSREVYIRIYNNL